MNRQSARLTCVAAMTGPMTADVSVKPRGSMAATSEMPTPDPPSGCSIAAWLANI